MKPIFMTIFIVILVEHLLRSHLGSSPNPDTRNLTRRSSLDGISSFLLVFIFFLGFVGIFLLTDVTAAVHTLNCSSEDDFKEGDNQAEDQPDVDHFHVRGGGQLLYLAGEDGGHHQHDGQVHGNGIAKEVFVKEDGDEGDEEQEDGGEEGGQQLGGDLPLQDDGHDHKLFLLVQFQLLNGEHSQVGVFELKIVEVLWHAVTVHHEHLDNKVCVSPPLPQNLNITRYRVIFLTGPPLNLLSVGR